MEGAAWISTLRFVRLAPCLLAQVWRSWCETHHRWPIAGRADENWCALGVESIASGRFWNGDGLGPVSSAMRTIEFVAAVPALDGNSNLSICRKGSMGSGVKRCGALPMALRSRD